MDIVLGSSRSSLNISTPRELGEYLAPLSQEELQSFYDGILSKYSNALEARESYLSDFINETGAKETQELYKFCDLYIMSSDKMNLLKSQIQDKSDNIKNVYIATAAKIDYFVDEVAEPIIEHRTVNVVINGYYSECEHQLVLDLAKMCLEDVMVEFMGGGPEDVAADITCDVGDLADVTYAVYSYIDCKHKK